MFVDLKTYITMRVLEKNGIEYPRTERCLYCYSLVELDKDDYYAYQLLLSQKGNA